jgi:radical SAM superfamily enzyme YgiQ (UPF0313 family)
MRILLIGANSVSFADGDRWIQKGRRYGYAPTTLTTLAALVPPELGAQVRVVDEAIEETPSDFWDADLVGISAMTPDAHRAYLLADRARARGIATILGGLHPSALPSEALQHADSVVIGYGEGSWPRLLRDFASGSLKPTYALPWEEAFRSLAPFPRRELLRRSRYLMPDTLEATRGCIHACGFCSIPRFPGGRYVCRDPGRLEEELERFASRRVLLLDSSPLEDPRFADALLGLLKRRKIRWYAGATLASVAAPGWAREAAASGCRGILLGFESLNSESLAGDGKRHNQVGEYLETCRRLHAEGIAVLGCFVFGFDGDDATVFDRTAEFVDRAGIDVTLYSIYTPFPGTQAFERLSAAGRILDTDWRRYDGRHVVFRPARISPETLQEGFASAWARTYGLPSILRRCVRAGRRLPLTLPVNLWFRFYRGTFLRSLPPVSG